MNPVLINGQNYSWANLTWIIFGAPLIGITEIEYSLKRGSTNNYGFGDQPTSFGYKNYEYSGSISVYIDDLRSLSASLAGKSILTAPPFTATNMFSGNGVAFSTDKLKNIRFLEDPFSSKQNDSMIVVKIPFIFAGLERK